MSWSLLNDIWHLAVPGEHRWLLASIAAWIVAWITTSVPGLTKARQDSGVFVPRVAVPHAIKRANKLDDQEQSDEDWIKRKQGRRANKVNRRTDTKVEP